MVNTYVQPKIRRQTRALAKNNTQLTLQSKLQSTQTSYHDLNCAGILPQLLIPIPMWQFRFPLTKTDNVHSHFAGFPQVNGNFIFDAAVYSWHTLSRHLYHDVLYLIDKTGWLKRMSKVEKAVVVSCHTMWKTQFIITDRNS